MAARAVHSSLWVPATAMSDLELVSRPLAGALLASVSLPSSWRRRGRRMADMLSIHCAAVGRHPLQQNTTQNEEHCYGHSYVSQHNHYERLDDTKVENKSGLGFLVKLSWDCLEQLKYQQFYASIGQSHTHLAQRRVVLCYIYFYLSKIIRKYLYF